MPSQSPESAVPLARRVEQSVRQRLVGRIRGLAVEEVQGRVVVRGEVHSQHAKQLVLMAALEVLPGSQLDACITVK
jgi:hypothetical protein